MKIILIIMIVTICFLGCNEENKDKPQTNLLADSLNIHIQYLEKKNDSIINELKKKEADLNYWFKDINEGEKFRNLGIDSPSNFIQTQLYLKPELIPVKAILGGTMHFGKIELLSSKWLIAEFDDGHILGRALYQYSINSNKKVEFTLYKFIEDE